MQVCTIQAAIPTMWKVQLRNHEFTDPLDREDKLETLARGSTYSRTIYWKIIETKFALKQTCSLLWQNDLKAKWTEDEWLTLFPEFIKFVKPTKLRYFQYRILNRALTTNIVRAKWHKEIKAECTFCNKEKETVIHMLVDCEIVSPLWNALGKFCKHFLEVNISFDSKLIILNNYKNEKRSLINLFIVTLKQHIYACKCQDITPSFPHFVEKLSYWSQIDKMYALQKDKIKQYYKKWQNIFFKKNPQHWQIVIIDKKRVALLLTLLTI